MNRQHQLSLVHNPRHSLHPVCEALQKRVHTMLTITFEPGDKVMDCLLTCQTLGLGVTRSCICKGSEPDHALACLACTDD